MQRTGAGRRQQLAILTVVGTFVSNKGNGAAVIVANRALRSIGLLLLVAADLEENESNGVGIGGRRLLLSGLIAVEIDDGSRHENKGAALLAVRRRKLALLSSHDVVFVRLMNVNKSGQRQVFIYRLPLRGRTIAIWHVGGSQGACGL